MFFSSFPPWIPSTTAETIVFPSILKRQYLRTFPTDSYSPEMTDGQVSLEEINQFIAQIEAEVRIRNLKRETNFKYLIYFVSLSAYIWILGHLFLFLVFSKTLGAGEVFPALFLMINFMAISKKGFKIFEFINRPEDEQMKEKCQGIADEHNKLLRSRGLKWNLPLQFPTWIELTRDLTKQNNSFELVTQLDVPPTTESTVIFPAQRYQHSTGGSGDIRNYGFSQDFYSPETTNGRISREEIQSFLSEINADIQKPVKVDEKIFWILYFFITICIFLEEIDIHFPKVFRAEGSELVFLAFVGVSFYLLVKEIYKYSLKGKTLQIKARCQGIVDKYNQTLRNRGLRWYLPENFPSWIELCKDYENLTFPIQLTEISGNQRKAQGQGDGQDEKSAPLLNNQV